MKYKLILPLITIIAIVFVVDFTAHAAPYGEGIYDANVPYGGQTAISISATPNSSIVMSPPATSGDYSGTATVTVYSTDVVGYKLYVRAVGSTSMVNGSRTIPASSNTTPAVLAINTWGYNVTGSTSAYAGVKLTDTLLKDATGPFTAGDVTTVTYGFKLDRAIASGRYTANLMYTAVPETP